MVSNANFITKIIKNKDSKIQDLKLKVEKLNQIKNENEKDIDHSNFSAQIAKIEEHRIQELKLEIEKLKLENKQKSEALEYESLKSNVFSTLIDVAEKELKISIRKKFDVKQ